MLVLSSRYQVLEIFGGCRLKRALAPGLLAYSVSEAPLVSFRIWLILSVKNLEKSSAYNASSADGAAASSLFRIRRSRSSQSFFGDAELLSVRGNQ